MTKGLKRLTFDLDACSAHMVALFLLLRFLSVAVVYLFGNENSVPSENDSDSITGGTQYAVHKYDHRSGPRALAISEVCGHVCRAMWAPC